MTKGTKTQGRPSDYTEEIADSICAQLIEGKSLRKICDQAGYPSVVTVMAWLRKHESFLNQYTRAREEQADSYTDEMDDIAHDNTLPVERARLIIETRKWTASKLKPKKYGDKLDLTTDGKELPAPIFGGVSAGNSTDTK